MTRWVRSRDGWIDGCLLVEGDKQVDHDDVLHEEVDGLQQRVEE